MWASLPALLRPETLAQNPECDVQALPIVCERGQVSDSGCERHNSRVIFRAKQSCSKRCMTLLPAAWLNPVSSDPKPEQPKPGLRGQDGVTPNARNLRICGTESAGPGAKMSL
jgi:hypothetical protein